MQYTDNHGDAYELEFRRFYEGAFGSKNYGIEVIAIQRYCNEPYDFIEMKPEGFVKGRHEYPNPFCLWVKNARLAQAMVDEGYVKWTGRTTEFYGVTYYEVMPNRKWWSTLLKKVY